MCRPSEMRRSERRPQPDRSRWRETPEQGPLTLTRGSPEPPRAQGLGKRTSSVRRNPYEERQLRPLPQLRRVLRGLAVAGEDLPDPPLHPALARERAGGLEDRAGALHRQLRRELAVPDPE